ncbi:MAG: transposase [Rhodocyclaceae bacterium]|nr:transposase [Rhodocyclaceae bacterium]MBX3670495.1 transposase [Rhodocyclaceae bacterium]
MAAKSLIHSAGEIRLSNASEHSATGTPASRPPEHWHCRGRLPHWEGGAIPQGITFRLYDSLPQCLLDQWRNELAALADKRPDRERERRMDAALDAGYGSCWLRVPRIAALVEGALLHFDGQRYHLHAWVVMPNHVHVLVTPFAGEPLSALLHGWKSFTAKAANKFLRRRGAFWQDEYFDRAIRDERHFNAALVYIENNPVAAGLCAEPSDWPFGSASRRRNG